MSIFSKLTSSASKAETPPAPAPQAAPAAKSTAPAPPAAPAYGIDDALRLVRSLPFDSNPELVAFVMKNTLESLKIDVEQLVDDAAARQDAIRAKNAALHTEIIQLEALLAEKRLSVLAFDAELVEMSSLRRRLDTAAPPRPAPQARQNAASSPAPAAPPVVVQSAAAPPAVASPPAAAPPSVAVEVTAATVEVIEEEPSVQAEFTSPPGTPIPTASSQPAVPAGPVAKVSPPAQSRESAKPSDTRSAASVRNAGVGRVESPYAKG